MSNENDSEAEVEDVDMMQEVTDRIGFKIPDCLKYFTTVQYGRQILVMGGMNTTLETPFGVKGNTLLTDKIYADAYTFDVKYQIFSTHTQMSQERAKHFSCLATCPKDPTRKLAIVAGGIRVESQQDLFRKVKTQTLHDCETVEMYDFQTKKWSIFDANLSIARHGASIC